MHIPDGFLDSKTIAVTAVIAGGGLAAALGHARRNVLPRQVPLMGLAAAFVFAAQMLNFPVMAGTSGHLVGGVLTAVLLGPSAAVIVISAVLIVQCLLFADGGMTALGANILNMGLIGAVGGYGIYRAVSGLIPGLTGKLTGAAFAAWVTTVLAAICCAGELAVSGTVPWGTVLPTMAGVHMLIGVGEAVITALVLAAVAKPRPELLAGTARPGRTGYAMFAVYGVLIALGLALFASPLASKWPDGLDYAAGRLGFESRAAEGALVRAPMGEYRVPGLGEGAMATSAAGGVGTVVVFGLAFGLARALAGRGKLEAGGATEKV